MNLFRKEGWLWLVLCLIMVKILGFNVWVEWRILLMGIIDLVEYRSLCSWNMEFIVIVLLWYIWSIYGLILLSFIVIIFWNLNFILMVFVNWVNFMLIFCNILFFFDCGGLMLVRCRWGGLFGWRVRVWIKVGYCNLCIRLKFIMWICFCFVKVLRMVWLVVKCVNLRYGYVL